VQRGGVRHVHQFRLVRRRHHHHVGQRGKVGHVEAARVRRPIGTHQPGAVDREAHRQVLDRHVVHHLVIGALQERRIDRAERPHPLRGKPRRERYRVLFGDAHVEAAFGERLLELVEAGARWHRRGDRADRGIAPRLGQQGLREHAGIARRTGGALACSPVTTLNFCTP
jgi:hypothetical protein